MLTLCKSQAQKAEKYLINPQPAPAFPGLVGTELNTETGKFITLDGGWEAGVDSFIEVSIISNQVSALTNISKYLIKTYIYDPEDDMVEQLKDFWLLTVESSKENIALSPYKRPELTFLSQLDENGTIMWSMDDYVSQCFSAKRITLTLIILLGLLCRWQSIARRSLS